MSCSIVKNQQPDTNVTRVLPRFIARGECGRETYFRHCIRHIHGFINKTCRTVPRSVNLYTNHGNCATEIFLSNVYVVITWVLLKMDINSDYLQSGIRIHQM